MQWVLFIKSQLFGSMFSNHIYFLNIPTQARHSWNVRKCGKLEFCK